MKKIRFPLFATGALLAAAPSAWSAVLLSENFDATDGAFTATAETGTPSSQWFHDTINGAWNTPGEGGGTATNELVAPSVTPGPLVLRLTFSHRYDFEATWDGGVVQYSVNGGAYTTLSKLAFSQNPYNQNGLIGDHPLLNQAGYSGKSAGYDDPAYLTSVADIPAQAAGATVSVRFRAAWDANTIGATPNWEITSVQLETLTDTDSDGMPDVFEDANGLLKATNDAGSDKDGDGLANLAEYLKHTDPQDTDTDNDNYSDAVETGTGTWVSATDTGSNPLNPDTDGDGLSDGKENLAQPFTGLAQPGSDPNKADTDGDTWNDYTEAAFGADPKLTASKPTLNALPLHLLAWWDFNEAEGATVALDESHSLRGFLEGAAISEDAGGRTESAGDRSLNLKADLGAARTMRTGGDFLNLAGGKDSLAVSFWQKLDAVSNSYGFYSSFIPASGDGRGASAHATWGDNNFYWDTSGCCNGGAQRTNVARPAAVDPLQWHHVVFQKNGGLKEIWVNGALITSTTGALALPTNFQALFVGAGPSGTSPTNGVIDDFAIFAESLTEAQILRLAAGDSPLALLPTAADADGDGMLDVYEDNNGLAKNNPGDRDSDLDGDGLTNYQEFTRNTRANNPDSDGDTVRDGAETGTGVFTSATNTGTDPLDTDSDNDGLPDGVETGTGVFVSAANTGTNPNKADTDGDSLNDRYEVQVTGTSPVNAAVPALGTGTGIGISFGAGATPIAPLGAAEIAGYAPVSQGNWNTTDAALFSGDVTGVIAPVAGSIVNAAGAATPLQITWAADGNYPANNGTASGNAKLMTGYLDNTGVGTGAQVTLSAVPYATYDVYVYFGSDGNGRTGSIASSTANGEFFYQTASGKGAAAGFRYDDFLPTFSQDGSGPAANFCVFRDQSAATFNLQVNRGNLNSGIHAVQIVPVADTDGDGISDHYEDNNGLNKSLASDRNSDNDGDGLSNYAEFAAHTKANDTDSDDDGLNDKVETNTGTWTGALNTGTNPLRKDTDGDGLSDGIEVPGAVFLGLNQPGSDPNLKDSDSDTWDDYTEAAYGGHPLQDTSIPVLDSAPLHLLAWWPYDDTSNPALAMDVTHSLPGTFRNGAAYSVDGGGRTGLPGDRSLDLTTNQTAGREMYVALGLFQNLASAQDQVTLSFWQKLTAIEASTVFKGFSTTASGTNRGMSAHATWSDSNFYWDTAGCCANPGQRISVAKPAAIDMTQWHHFAFVKNGTVKEIWVDGVPIVSQEGADPFPVDFYEFHVGGVNGGESIKGFIDDFAFFAEGLTESQIQALAAGATPASLLKFYLPITNVSFNNAARNLTLTFDSAAGKQYIIERSADLATWVPLTSTHPSAGISTSYVDAALPTTATRYFYRVSEAP